MVKGVTKNKPECNRVARLVVQKKKKRRRRSLKALFTLGASEPRQKRVDVLSKRVLITQLIAISTRQLQSFSSSSWNDSKLEIDEYVQNASLYSLFRPNSILCNEYSVCTDCGIVGDDVHQSTERSPRWCRI